MDATQMICDSLLESDEEESEEETGNSRGRPLAKLHILKNEHVPEAEFPLFLGDNVLGRDPSTCTLPLLAPSVSKQHVTISLSVYRTRGHQSEVEALVWDHGSLNGTRKGRLKLTSNVRYALSEGDSLILADIPCQYVTCAADALSSQRDLRTPVSRNSGVKNRVPDASRENRSDSGIGSKKSVNGSTKARVPLPDLEDTRRTPAKTSCLSFEQTPTQPQGTLVPDSDSDSDGEKRTGGDRKRKIVVSDSDAYKSSPTCSTFLSPTNKIVPESEDESSITPPSSTKNRPCRDVSFSTEETDMNVGRQQLQEKKSLVIMGDSEEEEGSKEERATPGTKPDKSGQPMPVNQESSASLAVGDKLPVFTPALSTDVIAPFNMDSDTDVEEEEERVAVASVTLNTNKQDDQPPGTVQFNMDSDTDVDEDSDALVSGPKSALLSDDATKPPVHVIQPQGISMDSDTDVDDDGDDDNVSKAAKTAKPTSSQAAHTASSALVTQPEDFHLDSDTDVDEDEEKECGTNVICSTTSETAAGLDLEKTGPESTPVAPHSLHLDSDPHDVGIPVPTLSKQLVGSDITHTSAGTGADLEVLSNCHTDMENECLLVIPVAITTLSATSAAATQSDSDADTDVDESSIPPAGNENNPANLKLNSDMDVEDKEAGGDQIPDLCREQTPLLPVPLLQTCSTPVRQSEEVEELETQAFASPSSGPFRYPPSGRPAAFSLSSDSQEEEDFTVAETQSFILQHRDHQKCSPDDPTQTSGFESSVNKKDSSSNTGRTFQLELSDSNHLQRQVQALAMDSTQPFSVTEDGGVNFEETQPYAEIMTADQTSGKNKSYLEATQAYGREVGCTIGTEKELHVDLALQATQAYIPEPYSDAEEERADETQPSDQSTSSTLAMAETQLMPVLGMEHCPTEDDRLSSVPQLATKEKVEQGEGAPHEQRQSEVLSIAETQPVNISNYEESEDSFPVLRKRKAKQLRPEEETQTSVNSDLSIAETQPMCISNYAQSGDEDSIPPLRKRKTKQLRLEEEETQTTVNSDLSVAETQPMCINRYEESDDEDSFPGPRKRKAKPLEHKDEDTQSLTNSEVSAIHALPMETKPCEQLQEEQVIQYEAGVSGVNKEDTHRVVNPAAETQPMCSNNFEESDGEDSIPILRKRKAKQLQPAEEETQGLVTPGLSVAETQPMDTGEGGESDEDSVPGPRKRKAKPLQHKDEDTQPLTNSEASAIDSQPIDTKSCEELQKGKSRQSEAGPSEVSEEETHRVVNPVAETEPMGISNYNESNAEDSERKAKQLLAEEEETQALVTPELPAAETQPICTNEDVEGNDEGSISGPRKRKAKLGSEASFCNTQNQTKDSLQCQGNEEMQSEAGTSGVSVRNRRGASVREDEEEQAECSEPPKRQTRGKRKTLPTSRGRRGKSRPDDDESEEEEEAEQATGANSKRYERGKEKRKLKEQERKEREEQERLKLEEERAEKERLEKEKKKQEEKEIADGIQKEKELLERQRKEKEALDREEKDRKEREQKEQEEKDRLEMATRAEEEQKILEEERKEQEHQARLEIKEKERLEKQKLNESHENKDIISEAPDRSRRATRRTAAVLSTTESQQESSNATGDDCPARRTRSRSNSSNSVSSERSASSTNTQESKGRGRGRGKGRGVMRTSELLQKTTGRSSNRRTVATESSAQRETTEWICNDIPSPRVLSRSNSSNSLNSEISSCSMNSQSRGRGGRQRGRGRKTETEPDSVPPISSQSDQQLVPRVTARGRKSRASELPPNQDEITRTNTQQPGTTTRGRGRASVNHSEPTAADEENPSNLEEGSASDPSLLPQGNDRERKQKTKTCETVETPKAPPFSDGRDSEEKRRGRKRDLEMAAEEGSSSKTSRGKRKVQKADEKTEKKVGTTSGHAKKNANESGEEVERKEDSKKVDEEVGEKKARSRPSRVQSKRKEKQEQSGMDTDAEAQQPQTPPTSVSLKRQLASLDSSPVAKTPRTSCASPVTTGRSRTASQGFKVLFTGVVDDAGERVLSRLGGSMAKTVADMNCLVTDKVRRTVKFLCAVAKGVPIVTTQWLEKSGKAGTFLSPSAYVVKDPEQENKFNFCLQESLRIASSQPLLQGYEIHVTKSVKPEPVHMKDIISCSGATFLPKMPSSHKPQTVVVSCEEDWPLCGPAVTVAIPVVTAEFILTGILQQKVNFETHKLFGPAATLQPTGGRGRGRKKS